ncbi:hypothetical protein HOF92_15375, partial [bacterium]|nr:hypothetical protein [bacterium]
MFRRIVVLFFLTFGIAGALFSTSGEHIPSPSQELGPADITVQLANKAARETAAHEQQNLHEKLQKSRQVQNKDYSKLIRSLYGRHQKASTQQIRHMDKFLEQARAFRNKDGSLSLRTVQRLLKANPDFTNLKGSSTEMIRRVSHEIKAYDQSTAREGRLFKQVNDLRTIAKIKKLKAHKPKAIRSITRPTAKTLKSEAVTQKRALVNELLKSGKFKSKAAIQAAVEARNPAVSKVVHLERKIQSFDRLIKAQPLNRARYHGSRAAQSVKETLLAMDVVQRGRTLASRLPGNQTLLDAYRTRRIEIFREFNQEGKYKNWKEVREAVKAGKSQDPRIQELRALDKKIQRVRYDLLRQKLPNIADSSRFSKRWGEVNSKINELKAIKAHLKKQPVVDQGALKSVRLHQKRAYLKQAKLQLQHDLLANKKFSSLKAIQKAVAGGSSLDPRISSLKRIQISEAKLAPKITRSVSAKVGAANRQYKAAAANHKPLIARASESVKTAAKQGVESIKKGWEYTKGASKDGVKWVKAKHSNGWEYTRQKGGKAWDTVKVRTSDGWEWARSRSQDAKGWAKGKADSGWKYVGEKTRSLKALTTAKAEQFKTGSIEKARAIYNESLSKASSVKEGISKQVQKASQRINDASKATSSRVRDTKNAAVNKARGAKDAAVNKARGAKDAAVNRARGAKDAAVNKARGAKDAVVNKAKGAKDAAVNKARSAKNAVANRANQTGEALKSSARSAQAGVKSGWEYTKGKTRGGIEYIKAKSVDGWQYTKVKAADGWNVTRMKTADGWEWARNRAQSTSGWAKGKTQAGWKYLGA